MDAFLSALCEEHQPSTPTENVLVEGLAKHHWLANRAQTLMTMCLACSGLADREAEKNFALFLRYQISNDRAFSKCLNDLLKLKAEKRKQQNGFEQQKLKQAAEVRKNELHLARVRIADAKAAYLEVRKRKVEDIRKRYWSPPKRPDLITSL